ncbi:hypothetical protein F5B19DRAFT_488724 [Rostrohypoxylon terebratum]|nr:hypothetical protein F5B19DRAFT_488724 [Rostrohypoxylon terebratum]
MVLEISTRGVGIFSLKVIKISFIHGHIVDIFEIVLLYFGCVKTRQIKDNPRGFDEQDVHMANPEFGKTNGSVAKFLEPNPENEERTYQIGIAFVGRGDESQHYGHAEIIIRDGDGLHKIQSHNNLDLTEGPPSVDQDEIERSGPQKLLKADNTRLRLLHLRNANDGGNSLELVLEAKREVRFYKYIDLYRICTTERRLKHIALRSCPQEHIALTDDCATFCHWFLEGLLDHLLERGDSHGGIDKDEYDNQKRLLTTQIHIKGGLVGDVEWRTYSPRHTFKIGNQ